MKSRVTIEGTPNIKPEPQPGQSDLIPGLLSAAALGILVTIVHMNFVLSIALAVGIYFAVRLLTHRQEPASPIEPTAEEILASIAKSAQQIPFSEPRRQVLSVVDQSRTLLTYVDEKQENVTAWQDYIRECLASLQQSTTRFVELSKHLRDSNHPSVKEFTEYVTTLSGTLQSVHKKLVDEDAADFAAHIDAYKTTLHEINQIYLGEGKTE